MRKLLATIKKELLLLWRDKIGLTVLFIMPMCFILIISLLQSTTTQQRQKMSIVLVSHDSGKLAQAITKGLESSKYFTLSTANTASEEVIQSIADGRHQALVIIPQGASKSIETYSKQSLVTNEKPQTPKKITLLFDPALQASARDAITNAIHLYVNQIQAQAMADAVSNILGTTPTQMNQTIIPITSQTALQGQVTNAKPNTVQQNVPAWSLFGMFFILIPLAGVMIKERNHSISQRLQLAPFSITGLLTSRIIAFTLINLLQLSLMLLIGILILPLFHLPSLVIGNQPSLVIITGICAALAATSFGIFIGAWLKTYEQAAAVGPILIVIAAAIGGIMVPIYMMPTTLRPFADFSPLYWGQSAFIDIFVRHTGFKEIFPELAKLLAFAILMLLFASIKLRRKL